jgi:hypothetical protein
LKRTIAVPGVLLLVLLLVARATQAQASAPVLGGQLFSTGEKVTIEVLPADAALTSTLYLLEPEEVRIATNRDVGAKVTVGPYAAGLAGAQAPSRRLSTSETTVTHIAERARQSTWPAHWLELE